MNQIDEIKRLKNEENLSFRQISERTGLDRRTVSKWYKSKEYPKYKRGKINAQVRDKIIPFIKQWIEEDIKLMKERKKRRIRSSSSMHDKLIDMGIKVSPATVRKYSSQLKPKEVFILQEYEAGIDMQVDWGITNINFTNGKTIKLYLFLATLPYSNTRFMFPYIRADYVSFYDGHKKAFDFFSGIPKRITYDNLSTAVKKVLTRGSREEQDKMLYFKNFYEIETNYCNLAKGNEKGSVENAVGYFKRYIENNYNVINDFEELRKISYDYSLKLLEKRHYKNSSKTISELLSEEQKHLRRLPDFHLEISDNRIVKSSSTSMISYDGVKYSVPWNFSSKELLLKATAEEIIVYSSKVEHKEICRHKRESKLLTNEKSDYRHYLDVLITKPKALSNARCIKRGNLPRIFFEYLNGLNTHQRNGNKQMIQILMLEKSYPISDIFFAMEYCNENKTFSYEAIKLTLNELNKEKYSIEKVNKVYPLTNDVLIDNKKYDRLLGGLDL